MKNVGLLILIIGFVLTVFTTFSFFTQEKVADLGTIEITNNEPHNVQWSPFIGLAIMVVGGFVVVKFRNK